MSNGLTCEDWYNIWRDLVYQGKFEKSNTVRLSVSPQVYLDAVHSPYFDHEYGAIMVGHYQMCLEVDISTGTWAFKGNE